MLSPRNIFNEPQLTKNLSNSISSDQGIHVAAYVDYSTKYGLGYLINNKAYGVYLKAIGKLSEKSNYL